MKAEQSKSIPVQDDMGLDQRTAEYDEKVAQDWRIRVLHASWAMLNKGLGHQFFLLFEDLLACIFGMGCGWLMGKWLIGINDPFQNYINSIIVMYFGITISFYSFQGYKPTFLRRQERELEIIVKSVFLGILLIFASNFMVFKKADFSRYIYVFDFVFVSMFLLLGRFGIKRIYRLFWRHNVGRERTLIVGQNSRSINFLRNQLRIQQFSRFELVGYITKENGNFFYVNGAEKVTILVKLSRFLEGMRVGTIFFALDNYSQENHQIFLDLLNASKKNKQQLFTLSETVMSNRYTYNLDQYVGLMGMKHYESELGKRLPLLIKRTVDIIGSFCGIIIFSPFLISLAVAIKLHDGGNVFHRRHVVGRNGKTFDAFKFRTMVENADTLIDADPKLKEEYKNNFKLKNDPRVTGIGKILRKLSLDELPQLFNVFIGQMSLVGPRMVTPEELERYGEFKAERVQVRPGISGYWQANGRQEVDYQERILMDRFYMYRWNIWMDFWIILKTVQKVLKMEGAY